MRRTCSACCAHAITGQGAAAPNHLHRLRDRVLEANHLGHAIIRSDTRPSSFNGLAIPRCSPNGYVEHVFDEPRLQYLSAGSARADGSCACLNALMCGIVQRTTRPPAWRQTASIARWRERCNPAGSAQPEIAESGYCSRCPDLSYQNLARRKDEAIRLTHLQQCNLLSN
jgi:hypothetical protein